MAIAVTHLTTSNDPTDGTSFVTASVSPAATRLIIACYAAARTDNAEPTTPTVSGNGLTWSTIDSHFYNDQAARDEKAFIFAANTGASPSAGAITFSHGATTHHGGIWSVFECSGADQAAGVAQCFVQIVKSTANTTATSVTLNLASASHVDNRPFIWVLHHATEVTTPRTNWTELGDTTMSNPSIGGESQWRSDTFETTASATWTGLVRMGAMAFEIKVAGGGGGAPTVARRTLLGVGV